ncbi:MAG TPA: type II toxin-antitoxin system VapC family toxin [Phycisphaerae bacterium]|nr:type II toxin-antitoxin system VapC family toxin [Phycisphaerae bacterium]HQA44175.1 type II toxin-antitoxin system VapC family toxin [Phycisphaerae bacterium]
MACLDTNVLLDLLGRGTAEWGRRAREQVNSLRARHEDLVTTRFNVAELWVGIFRSRNPLEERRKVKAVLDDLTILDFDQLTGKLFGRFKAHLLNIGRPVSDMDILIAAVAQANGHSLVTRNPADFQNIPGLTVLTY